MSGHNHYASCTCGWCLKMRGGRSSISIYSGGASLRAFRSFESRTTPNARCPVCGASVFFFQSAAGGRVFFDELGPPWPKHPCTDNGRPVSAPSFRADAANHPARWARDGWTPVIVQSSKMVSQWHVVPMEILEKRIHTVVLTAQPLRVPTDACVSFKGFDASGYGLLAVLNLNAPDRPTIIEVFERARFSRASPYDVSKARARSA